MSSESEWNQVQSLVDQAIQQVTQKYLSDVEIQVLKGAWEGKTYDAIALEAHLTVKYVSEVGGRLWQLLSEVLGEEVKKTNFRQALQRYQPGQQTKSSQTQLCCAELNKPGALLRIKAPIQFGKTTLMANLLKYSEQQGYRAIALNLRDAVKDDFESLESFLQWFMASVTYALDLAIDLESHWRKSLGNSKIKCRTYFEKYLLNSPLVIAIDELDRLFPHPLIAGEFLGMLRTWHEDAKTKPLWSHLRLIVLHTEVYTQLDINQSPFNAGTEVQLAELSVDQIKAIAPQFNPQEILALVGGHPFLVAQTASQSTSLDELLASVTSPTSIYRSHLERQWYKLQSHPALIETLSAIAATNEPILLSQFSMDEIVKLYDLGLIQLQQQQVSMRYSLYRQYFRKRLGIE